MASKVGREPSNHFGASKPPIVFSMLTSSLQRPRFRLERILFRPSSCPPSISFWWVNSHWKREQSRLEHVEYNNIRRSPSVGHIVLILIGTEVGSVLTEAAGPRGIHWLSLASTHHSKNLQVVGEIDRGTQYSWVSIPYIDIVKLDLPILV